MKKANDTVKCRHVSRELIQRFDEGTLQDLPEELKAHLKACLKCRREMEKLLELQHGLDRLATPVPAPDYWKNFLPNLRRRMEKTAPPWRRRDLVWIPSLGLALIGALLLLISPARIAPPTWVETSQYERTGWETTSSEGDQLTDQDWKQLELISENQDPLELYLDDSELLLVDRLSEFYPYSYYDSIDRLTAMEDETVSDLLEKLKAQPIIQS